MDASIVLRRGFVFCVHSLLAAPPLALSPLDAVCVVSSYFIFVFQIFASRVVAALSPPNRALCKWFLLLSNLHPPSIAFAYTSFRTNTFSPFVSTA